MMIRGSDVTVVIPTIKGREHLLKRALASVEGQQVTPAAVEVHTDYHRRGAHFARNEAIKNVKTDWIAFLDDDDEFVGGRDPLACVQHGRLVPEPINVPFGIEQEYWLRKHGNFIPVTYLVRTAAVRAVGGFPAPYSFDAAWSRDCDDFGLQLRLLDAGYTFHHVTGVRSWRYHFHEANLGGRGVERMHELGDIA